MLCMLVWVSRGRQSTQIKIKPYLVNFQEWCLWMFYQCQAEVSCSPRSQSSPQLSLSLTRSLFFLWSLFSLSKIPQNSCSEKKAVSNSTWDFGAGNTEDSWVWPSSDYLCLRVSLSLSICLTLYVSLSLCPVLSWLDADGDREGRTERQTWSWRQGQTLNLILLLLLQHRQANMRRTKVKSPEKDTPTTTRDVDQESSVSGAPSAGQQEDRNNKRAGTVCIWTCWCLIHGSAAVTHFTQRNQNNTEQSALAPHWYWYWYWYWFWPTNTDTIFDPNGTNFRYV